MVRIILSLITFAFFVSADLAAATFRDGIDSLGRRIKTERSPILKCRSIDPTFSPQIQVAILQRLDSYEVAVRMSSNHGEPEIVKRPASGLVNLFELDLLFEDGNIKGALADNGLFRAELELSNHRTELICANGGALIEATKIMLRSNEPPQTECSQSTELNLDNGAVLGSVAYLEEHIKGVSCPTVNPNGRMYKLRTQIYRCGIMVHEGERSDSSGQHAIRITDRRFFHEEASGCNMPNTKRGILVHEIGPNGNRRVLYSQNWPQSETVDQ